MSLVCCCGGTLVLPGSCLGEVGLGVCVLWQGTGWLLPMMFLCSYLVMRCTLVLFGGKAVLVCEVFSCRSELRARSG